MLKFTNTDKTSATFNGASFSLDAPENWESIGDTPTREAVLLWLASTHPEESTTPLIYSDLVPEVPATFDPEGVELTPYIPEIPPQVIGGGEVVIVEVQNTPEPADTIPEPTPAQLRKRELAELSTTFRDDMQVMRDSWLSAFIAGDDETKVQVESDMEDTRLQYVSDKAEITARYSNQ